VQTSLDALRPHLPAMPGTYDGNTVIQEAHPPVETPGIRVSRDSEASVRYSERVNSCKRSCSLQRTDRYGMVGQEPEHFQRDA
jgi:hypothetical protein